jgi:hypothetical protein
VTSKVDRLLARLRAAEAADEEALRRARERTRTLRALEALVDEVGFTGAAELLGVSKQAVHDRVLKLRRLA